MLEIIAARIEKLKQQLDQAQKNIQMASQNLEREKNLHTQLIGHFNEAHHLMMECQKVCNLEEQDDEVNEDEYRLEQ